MIETDRLISAAPESTQEAQIERALRPRRLEEYVGQQKIREQLSIFIEAAIKSNVLIQQLLVRTRQWS